MTTKLKQIMEERGLSQKELAHMAGLTTSTISRYANGKELGSIIKWWCIADALQVSLDDLLEVKNGEN